MTRERTILLQKDKEKGMAANNYRSITCQPLVWKLLIGVIAEEVYGYLDTNKFVITSITTWMWEKI